MSVWKSLDALTDRALRGLRTAQALVHRREGGHRWPRARDVVGRPIAPTLLVLGVYNKIVKTLGSDRFER